MVEQMFIIWYENIFVMNSIKGKMCNAINIPIDEIFAKKT